MDATQEALFRCVYGWLWSAGFAVLHDGPSDSNLLLLLIFKAVENRNWKDRCRLVTAKFITRDTGTGCGMDCCNLSSREHQTHPDLLPFFSQYASEMAHAVQEDRYRDQLCRFALWFV